MKMKKLAVGLLSGAMILGAGVTAFASSDTGVSLLENLTVKVSKTGSNGELKELPKGAVLMNKEVVSEEESNLSSEIKAFNAGEMPGVPEGAVLMNKESISSEIKTFKDSEMPKGSKGSVEMKKEIVK